jgi:hypothetical protein
VKKIDPLAGCVGSTIQLRSGLYFNLKDPKPEQFTLADMSAAYRSFAGLLAK